MNAKNGYHEALIKEFIASADNPRVPWLVTLRGLDLPLASPPDQGEWVINEKFDRTDLTALPFVTIDSAKTEDMDDALYIEDLGDKWKLTVAIADPTSYVQEGSPTDREAAKRAFTVYLPGCNIPMIPRILSDDICSLREGIARPVLCGTIFADKEESSTRPPPSSSSEPSSPRASWSTPRSRTTWRTARPLTSSPATRLPRSFICCSSSPPAARSGAQTIPCYSRTALTMTSSSTRTAHSRRSWSRTEGPLTKSSRSA